MSPNDRSSRPCRCKARSPERAFAFLAFESLRPPRARCLPIAIQASMMIPTKGIGRQDRWLPFVRIGARLASSA